MASSDAALIIACSRSIADRRQHGKIAGVDVVLAATGIGPGAAAICGFELLLCAANIREILFSGTSGFTPQVGAPMTWAQSLAD